MMMNPLGTIIHVFINFYFLSHFEGHLANFQLFFVILPLLIFMNCILFFVLLIIFKEDLFLFNEYFCYPPIKILNHFLLKNLLLKILELIK